MGLGPAGGGRWGGAGQWNSAGVGQGGGGGLVECLSEAGSRGALQPHHLPQVGTRPGYQRELSNVETAEGQQFCPSVSSWRMS